MIARALAMLAAGVLLAARCSSGEAATPVAAVALVDIGAGLVAEWATGSVVFVPLTATTAEDGSTTYSGAKQVLLTGLDNPVAVTIAPDGALLVGEWTTGTVYRVTTAA